MNKCGECTLCCRLTSVPELRKPFGIWCSFCNIGNGCKIYEDRPNSCKSFECFWYSKNMPLDMRPDKSHVVLEKLIDKNIYLVLVNTHRDNAWKSPKVIKLINTIVKDGNAVVVSVNSGKEKHMLLPSGMTKEKVEEELIEYYRMYVGGI